MERVVLNSPKPLVLATLKVGDELDVVLVGASLVAQTKDAKVAGALTPAKLAELIECIEKGNAYKATVLKIAGGRCDVEIRPR